MTKKKNSVNSLENESVKKKPKIKSTLVESATSTATESSIIIGVLTVCALALVAVFGSSLMAGIVALTNSAPLESAEIGNNYDANIFHRPDAFKLLYGNIDNVKYFDVYNASVATYGIYRNSDKCLIDVCVGTKCSPRVVTSCANGESNCRLQEAFVFNEGNYSRGGITKVGNWVYNCPNGCNKGACVIAPPAPECTDSDGGNNIYVKGTTKGYLLDSSMYVEKSDYCVIEGEENGRLVESFCYNGQVADINHDCPAGCVDGECILKLEAGDIIRPYNNSDVVDLYYYGKDSRKHYMPADVFTSWGFDTQKIKSISQRQFNLINTGANLTIRPVGYLSEINGNYYFIMPGNKLKKFENKEVINHFFGEYWEQPTINPRVRKIDLNFLANYEIVPGLITVNDKYPDGSLVSFEGYMGIFYIQDGKRRIFINTDTFYQNDLTISLVASAKTSSTIDYPDGEEISTIEDQFIYPY
jgi:hypothetical protein